MAKTKKRYNKKRKTKSITLRKMRGGGDPESIFRTIAKLKQDIREEEKKNRWDKDTEKIKKWEKELEGYMSKAAVKEHINTKLGRKRMEKRRVRSSQQLPLTNNPTIVEKPKNVLTPDQRRMMGEKKLKREKEEENFRREKRDGRTTLIREMVGKVDMGDGVTHQGVQNVMRKANESGRLTDDRNKFITRHMSKLMKNCEDENVRLKQNYDEELRRQEAAATEAAAKKAAAHEKALAEAQQKAEDDKSVIHRQAEALVNKIIKGRDNAVKKAAEAKQALLQAGEQVAALRMRRSGAQTLRRKLADATDKINDMENEKAALKKELHEASIAINQCNQEKAVAADQCDQEKKAAIAAAKAAAMRMNIGKRLQDRGGEEEEKAEYDRDPANVKLQNYIDDDSANTEKYADIPFDENRANSGWIVENIDGGRRRRRTRHRRQQKKKVMKSRKKHRKNKRKTNKKTKRKNKLKYKK